VSPPRTRAAPPPRALLGAPCSKISCCFFPAVVLQGSRVEVKGGDVAEGKVGARVASSTMFFSVHVMHSAGIGRKTMAKSESCRSWMWPIGRCTTAPHRHEDAHHARSHR
jgi:hypothetical protein